MGKVFIDGERVEFEGNAPQSCGEACELIEGFLSGQGLTLESIAVDGKELSIEEARILGAFSEIAFVSVSPQVQLLGMCKRWRTDCSDRVKQMDALASIVLRREWDDSQIAVVELLDELRPLVEGVSILLDYGTGTSASWSKSLSSSFESSVASINRGVDAVESRDSVVLSDTLAFAMIEAWSAVGDCLSREVIPVLEKELPS